MTRVDVPHATRRPTVETHPSRQTEFQQRLSEFSLGSTADAALARFHRLVREHLSADRSFDVERSATNTFSIGQSWPESSTHDQTVDFAQITAACQEACLTRSIQTFRNYGQGVVCAPIVCWDQVTQVWVITLPPSADVTDSVHRDVQRAAQYYGLWHERRHAFSAGREADAMATIVEWISSVHHCHSLRDAAEALASSVSELPAVVHVAVALAEPELTLRGVAGSSDFRSTGPVASALSEACHESLMHENGVHWPPTKDQPQHALLAHQHAAQLLRVRHVCTQPLQLPNRHLVGVLVWSEDTAAEVPQHTRLMRAASTPLADLFTSLQEKQQGVFGRIRQYINQQSKQANFVMIALGALLACSSLFVHVPYQVRCRCVTEPASRRFAVAPFDGIVSQGLVHRGDIVRQGEILAQMDSRELAWELSGVRADQQRAASQRDAHLAEERIPEAMMARLEYEKLTSQRQLLEHRESQLEVRSAMDGFVLSGDLDKNQNAPVRAGDSLYEIGPISPMKIMVHVPSEEIPHVHLGSSVKIWIDGSGSSPVEGPVTRILPRSLIVEGRNVFVAELEVANDDQRLRPGMRGVARISSDAFPLAWNLFHRPWELIASRLSW